MYSPVCGDLVTSGGKFESCTPCAALDFKRDLQNESCTESLKISKSGIENSVMAIESSKILTTSRQN